MTHTVTLLPDHKGVNTPKNLGDEYYVDIVIDISDYAGTTEIFASDCGLSSINAVCITGQWATSSLYLFVIKANQATGGYYRSGEPTTGNANSFDFHAIQKHVSQDYFNAVSASIGDIGGFRCRVWGHI